MIKPLKDLCLATIGRHSRLFGDAVNTNLVPEELKQSVFKEKYQFINGIWSEKTPSHIYNSSDWGNYKL